MAAVMAVARLVEIPPAALPAWLELLRALGERGPGVCKVAPETWWSPRPELVDDALFGCACCPVRRECRAYAIAAGEREGVWGGLTEAERRRMARAAS